MENFQGTGLTTRAATGIPGGLLARESTIFHDLLTIPQPDDVERVDGCPLVPLSDDLRDLEVFLKALFDYKSVFFLAVPHRTQFDTISGFIRLSKKYQVNGLYRRAMDHLSAAFPMTLRDYPPSLTWGLSPEETLHGILLARELSLDWILPSAFYSACDINTCGQLHDGPRFLTKTVF
ncbi:hypothetical protein B0H13DRAFT_1619319 [Mycena leptocephala]|nr:hypothetical protein B0H13DRAFT_1619319 [Mycena leptocephala]